jgi:cytochrome c5
MLKAMMMTLVGGIFLITAVCSLAADKGGPNGKTLFENNCGKCHNLDRATSKKKTKDEWQATVLRMKQKGAAINYDEAKLIADYLSETYKK